MYSEGLLNERLFQSQNSDDVSSLYMDNGYLFFNVTPIEQRVEGDSIDLLLKVYEGLKQPSTQLIYTEIQKRMRKSFVVSSI